MKNYNRRLGFKDRLSRFAKRTVLGATLAGAAVVGIKAMNNAENARIDAQIAPIISQAMGEIAVAIVGAYQADPSDFLRIPGPAPGTVTLFGYDERPAGPGRERYALTIDLGTDSNGNPDPHVPLSISIGHAVLGSGVNTGAAVELAAPGATTQLCRSDGGNGYFACYVSGPIHDPTSVFADTDDRHSSVGSPEPDPRGIATSATELAESLLPDALKNITG